MAAASVQYPKRGAGLLPVPAQVSIEEGEYLSDREGVAARLARAGMTAVFEERIPPELNAAWQVGG